MSENFDIRLLGNQYQYYMGSVTQEGRQVRGWCHILELVL